MKTYALKKKSRSRRLPDILFGGIEFPAHPEIGVYLTHFVRDSITLW